MRRYSFSNPLSTRLRRGAHRNQDSGPGNDRLITPVSLAQLSARGITVTGFETIEINTSNAYLSECF